MNPELKSITSALPVAPPRREAKSAPPRPLAGPDLRGADLRRHFLVGARLEGADLRGADLREADLRGADLLGARIEGADLRGAILDQTRLVEIRVPGALPVDLVNQIRDFDFRRVMTRLVPPPAGRTLPCPYRDARMRPLLYEWGSRTWDGGRDWAPPEIRWTLEEICAAVLDELGCRHDLERPLR
ncbi:MAG: pentapeptide repeat-containing protein [Planctomycetota bacterium]